MPVDPTGPGYQEALEGDPRSPVIALTPDDKRKPQGGVGLCLSGGGYRAMAFHIGALWRLYETGLLARMDRISSVSGGSIAAALLGLRWDALTPAQPNLAAFKSELVAPLRRLASETIDVASIIVGLLTPGRISDRVAAAYDRHLFRGATLQNLPEAPRFIINASNIQSGVLWRFSRAYMADYRVGRVLNPRVRLADAVAASSAFPPLLSPFELKLDPATVGSFDGDTPDLQTPPYTSRAFLADGGVYDNLGLETVWKRCETVFVSNGGGQIEPEPKPHSDWARHSLRVLNLIDSQVRARRLIQVMDSYQTNPGDQHHRHGAYWGIRTDIARLASSLPAPIERTTALADTPTRLQAMPAELQERLINWGYAICDASIRTFYDPAFPAPSGFPYSREV